MSAEAPAEGSVRGARLASATSAYLRAAAEQPIDWHPWGPEAFELARRTKRPILLDIGASWCHWCHVMDEGTYSDPEVARLLGTHFVAVKVDRDEHPEIDRRYQRQVGALTGEGGWPLTGFLTSDGEVFLGGTYFPPTDGHGRPGFRRLLKEVARLWTEEPDRIRESAQQIQGALARMRARRAPTAGPLPEFVAAVRAEIAGSYDPVHGGFGMAPKFPHPTAVSFLLWDAYANGSGSSADRAHDTLLRMADGGMYDQVGGGFHRYSVDEGWHIPHFEKMGVDNAALLLAYVDGAQRFAEPRFPEVIGGTIGWVRSTLQDPEGGFAASQDADNAPGDDGNYFTWTKAEIRQALDGDDGKFALRFFGVGTDGRMHHDPDRNVLFRLLPAAEAANGLAVEGGAAQALPRVISRLATARAARPAPGVDRALYADINGRFIAAFARAAAFGGDRTVLADARRAADRFLRTAYRPHDGIAHRVGPDGASGFGMLEDQVAFGAGLVELAGVTAEPKYATTAVDLFETVDREFRGEDGLLRDLAPRLYDGPSVPGLAEPSYPLEDSPHLSANAGAALAWYRLAALVKDDRWRSKADALLPPIAARIGSAGLFAAGSAWAAGLSVTEPATVVVEGSGAVADRLEQAARRAWHPNAWVFRGSPPPPFGLPDELSVAGAGGEPRALVCFGSSCAPPVTEPAALASLLATPRSPAR
jgi:uncharacterized protein